jgi:hypothetical protein
LNQKSKQSNEKNSSMKVEEAGLPPFVVGRTGQKSIRVPHLVLYFQNFFIQF